jgi:hypothetical protein
MGRGKARTEKRGTSHVVVLEPGDDGEVGQQSLPVKSTTYHHDT